MCSSCPPPTPTSSLRVRPGASSGGDGASRADISPQRSGPLMSMTLALTCPSSLKAPTSSKRSINCRGWKWRQISLRAVSRLEEGGDEGVFHLCLLLPFVFLSKMYPSWLQVFRPFSSGWYPAVASAWCYLTVVGERDHISTILFTASRHLGDTSPSSSPSPHSASSGTPRITRPKRARRIPNSRTAVPRWK